MTSLDDWNIFDEEVIKHWARQGHWSIVEGTVLLLEKNPCKRLIHKLVEQNYYTLPADFVAGFVEIYETASRYVRPIGGIALGDLLHYKNDPVKFLTWAENKHYPIPAKLKEFVAKMNQKGVDWEKRYKGEREKNTQLEKKLNEMAQNEGPNQSLQKMILGMAMAKYAFNPSNRTNVATGEKEGSIMADLDEYGIKLSNDTIKRLLNTAAETIDYEK